MVEGWYPVIAVIDFLVASSTCGVLCSSSNHGAAESISTNNTV
jgi:hypothetical protein